MNEPPDEEQPQAPSPDVPAPEKPESDPEPESVEPGDGESDTPSEVTLPSGESDAESDIDEAKRRIADQVGSGRSPYDFSASIVEEEKSKGVSTANIAAGVALIGLFGAAYFGLHLITSITSRVERLDSAIESLSGQVNQQRERALSTGKIVVRTELVKSIQALRQVDRLGDPRLSAQAKNIRNEAEKALELFAQRKKEGRRMVSTPVAEKPEGAKPAATQGASAFAPPAQPTPVVTPAPRVVPSPPGKGAAHGAEEE